MYSLRTVITPVLLFALMLSAGCTSIRGYPSVDSRELPPAENSTFLLTDEEFSDSADQKSRNALINAKRRDIDSAYQVFEQTLYREGVVSSLATDWSVLALTATSAAAGGESTKAALGAASAFIVGSKAAFDNRALFNNTSAVIVAKMRADRALVGVDLLRGMTLDYEAYTTYAAAIDLVRYYYVGTIPAALAGLAETVSVQENEARELQAQVVHFSFQSGQARTCLINFWKPGNAQANPVVAVGTGIMSKANTETIRTWIANSQYKGMKFGVFMNTAQASDARIAAVNELVGKGLMDPCPL